MHKNLEIISTEIMTGFFDKSQSQCFKEVHAISRADIMNQNGAGLEVGSLIWIYLDEKRHHTQTSIPPVFRFHKSSG